MVEQRTEKRFAGLCAIASALGFCLTAAPSIAQTPVFPSQPFTVQPAFAAEARDNISGANCTGGKPGSCLAVNDATNFAQLFSVGTTALRPGPLVALTSVRTDTAVRRAEGASHDRGFFYVVTSRAKGLTVPGLPGGQSDTSFAIIRLPIDGIGVPPVPGAPPTVQVSEKIRDALNAGIAIPQIAGEQLSAANSDIGGIAVKDGVIHVAFRAPVLSGKAFILSAPATALFGSDPLNLTVHTIGLGLGTGINDLATVSDGVLMLAGPTRDVVGVSSLFHFNDSTGQVKPVAELVEPIDRKGEGLLLLEENAEFYRVLVLFDGVPDGGPIEYLVPR
jgi:hypothetical protein